MEKTWEVKEEELRQEIAQKIGEKIDALMPPIDEVELAIYESLSWAAEVALGK
jgi:hypothetical protein